MTHPYNKKGKRKAGSFYHLHHIAQHHKKPIQCFKCNTTNNLQRDHITRLTDNGTDTLDNLQILCKKCHEQKTHQEQKKIKKKALLYEYA